MRQIDLFSEVLHSYAGPSDGQLTNTELYAQVAQRTDLAPEDFQSKVPVGRSGQQHNLLKRKIRWHQQTLKRAGIIAHVDGERGVWRLTSPASNELNAIKPGVSVVGFSTDLGVAILGSCDSVFAQVDAPIVPRWPG